MLNPTKKGILSYNNAVSIRGHENINIFAAMCMIMYGSEYEERFIGKDLKQAAQVRNELYMNRVQPVVSTYDALYEIYTNYLEQNERARKEFEAMEVIETTEDTLTEVLTAIRNGKVETTVPVEDVVKEAEVVEEVEAAPVEEPVAEVAESPVEEVVEEEPVKEETVEEPAVEEAVEEPAVEESETEEVEEIEEVEEDDTIIEELPTIEEDTIEEDPILESINEEQEAVVETQAEPDFPYGKSVDEQTAGNTVLELVRARRETVSVENTLEETEYHQAIVGKLQTEVGNFKLMPNDVNARALLDKLMSVLPGVSVVQIVYNKEINKALFIEFGGAASMLSSFRILALGLMSMSR